jgi:hypothetical protein
MKTQSSRSYARCKNVWINVALQAEASRSSGDSVPILFLYIIMDQQIYY